MKYSYKTVITIIETGERIVSKWRTMLEAIEMAKVALAEGDAASIHPI